MSVDEIAALEAAATEARMQRFDEPGALVAVGDMEVLFTISPREGRFVVEKRDRGSESRLLASGDSIGVAASYLRFLIWDGAHGLTAAASGVTPPVPSGFSVGEHETAGLTLSWTESGASHSVQLPNRIGARRTITGFAAFIAAETWPS
ncbi:hypothetical protein [Agromyces humatus]|uniref:Uncharacterized protein n=1 Tax=Agromyces humatus TaxID=279573 RepID=A0ABP4WZI5_9MICO|nr:hypothetical protein [Agromyces humatus]